MRALVPLAAAAALTVAAPPAGAYRIGAATFAGSGVANPGIGTLPAMTTLGISGTATLYGPYGGPTTAGFDNGRVVTCGLQANGTESAALGFGAIYGACGPVPFDRCTYVRVLAAWTVACANGTTAEWVFRPHGTSPVTSYDLAGTITYALVP